VWKICCLTTGFSSTQHLCGSKHTVVTVCLRDWPGRQSVIGEISATSSSSGPSEFATFEVDLCKALMSTDIQLLTANHPEVRNLLLQQTLTEPPDESTLRENYLPKYYEETMNKI
jgi:hypothetical protein